MSLRPVRVGRFVALNPVARAVAWANMVKAASTAKIKLWDLPEGEEAQDLLASLAEYLLLVLLACEEEQLTDERQEAVRIGHHAIRLMSDNAWLWRAEHLVTLDDALDASALLARTLKPESINKAGRRLAQI